MQNTLVPYSIDPSYAKKVAYFSMEFAIDQSLKIYSGGLGFLSGSHMRSAFDLKQNIVGIGMLWKYGYYDQQRDENQFMKKALIRKQYSFLQDTGLVFTLNIHGADVHVKAFHLPSDTFGTAPMYFLSTDLPENDYLSQTITDRLYDPNEATRIAQSMVLGIGGAKLLEILGWEPEIYHLNEGHGVPLAFYLYSKYKNVEEVKNRLVFTTHTPEKAGNEEHSVKLLEEMGFFGTLNTEESKKISGAKETLNYTLSALRLSKLANGVSAIHGKVSNELWKGHDGICNIISITNAQNKKYWEDPQLGAALADNKDEALIQRKKQLKKELFEVVADQTGKLLDPEVLTIVWARRFAGYKRAGLLFHNYERFLNLVGRKESAIQVIWAGKPYPEDTEGTSIFNDIIAKTSSLRRCAVLTGYELKLSAILKKGADIWLNTPKPPQEASGTSGMTAAMNGAVNFSVADGWFPEFAVHGKNSFVIPAGDIGRSEQERNSEDSHLLMNILEKEIIPAFYQDKIKWTSILKASMKDVIPAFDSERMAKEYYEKMYSS